MSVPNSPPPRLLPDEEWLWQYAESVPDAHVQRKLRFLTLRWAGETQTSAAAELDWDPSPASKFEKDWILNGVMAVLRKKGKGGANWYDNPDPENVKRRIRELDAAGADLTDAHARVAFTSLHSSARSAPEFRSWGAACRAAGVVVRPRPQGRYTLEQRAEAGRLHHEEGLALTEVAESLNVSRTTVRNWVVCGRSTVDGVERHNRIHIDSLPDRDGPATGYLIGAILGDAAVIMHPKVTSRVHEVRLGVRDIEFAEEFARIVGEAYGYQPRVASYAPNPKKGDRPDHIVSIKVRGILDHIGGLFDTPPTTDFWVVQPNWESADEPFRCALLRGFYDAEGTVNRQHGQITASGICLEGLEGVQRLLRCIGIEAKIYRRKRQSGRKQAWDLAFARHKFREVFHDRVGFSIPRKADALWRSL